MHVTALLGLMPPPASAPSRGLQHLGEHSEVRRERGQQLCLNLLPPLPTSPPALCPPPSTRTPHPPQGPGAATALLGRRACRLAPTSLLLSNSQSAEPGDLSAN
ncbi:hypothetical protein EYF80_062264 [Liparis tanakae]|uniref:Uncharacterized protein n=1 Tax=Liparis tanakae TaxID=230148 RepID=A0A4Z2EG18_9TELE|nr:hypothetical protein EYF80_062264 [Liparis tanakae]